MEELEPIQKHAERVRLSEAERSAMREVLISHMRANPVRIVSPFWGVLSPFRHSAFALSLVLLVGGGSAIAAEGSLPGDTFYPVKVSLVEPVTGAFQISEEAQASWQAELAGRRLSEIDDLVAGNLVSEEMKVVAAIQIARSASKAAQKIDTLAATDERGAGKAAVKLERTLIAHGSTLRVLRASGDASSTPILAAAADVAEEGAPENARAMHSADAFSLSAAHAEFSVKTAPAKMWEREGDEEEYKKASKLFKRTRDLAREARDRDVEESDD